VNIRNRITLWITAAGLLAGLLFSIVISFELIEQPYKLLDAELDSQAHTLLAGFGSHNGILVPEADMAMLNTLGRLYWLKIFTAQHEVIYASDLAGMTNLPFREKNQGYTVRATIPGKNAGLDQDNNNEVPFRVRVFSIPVKGHEYLVQIARPMEKLQEEISDLIIAIVIGLILYTIILLLLGYVAAGKILKPIADINTLAREINEKTLEKRIPLGKNRDELHTLSSSLNQMFDRLQFSFQRQKEFLANASHELKTPIAMQRLFFNEAQQRKDLPPEFLDQLGRQLKTVYRMDRLVKNLLDLSALELQDSFETTSLDLGKLAASVLQDFQNNIQVAGIRLTTDIQNNVRLQGDEEKIRRILINLLDNAIKYNSGDNKEIRFHLALEKDQIHLEIYNTGLGIPAEDLQHVFKQFYRIEKSRATALGGSGLGLTIVKRIVELHHGSIEIASSYGHWIQVQIRFPLHPPVI